MLYESQFAVLSQLAVTLLATSLMAAIKCLLIWDTCNKLEHHLDLMVPVNHLGCLKLNKVATATKSLIGLN